YQAQDGPRARRPEQTRRDAEQQRRSRAAVRAGRSRESVAERDARAAQPIGEARQEQREPEHEHERERDPPSPLVRSHDPAAADGRERRNDGERNRHPDEQRQTAAPKRLVGAREHERQHRKDAWAQDREQTAQKSKYEQQHRFLSRYATLNFIARPFMQ